MLAQLLALTLISLLSLIVCLYREHLAATTLKAASVAGGQQSYTPAVNIGSGAKMACNRNRQLECN
jgi:hypothetical protein